MAERRRVRKTIKNLQRVKTWQLVVLLVLMGFVSATFLRLNNVGMLQRREAVINADKQGGSEQDREITQNRLLDLQHYVAQHMNTDKNDVYLAAQYERDKEKRIQEAATTNQSGEVINAKVDAICKPQFSNYNQGYVDCFAREYAKYAPGANPVSQVKMTDPDSYRFVFAPPFWSPDFAGFSLLVCAVLAVMIFVRLISLLILRMMLKHKYRD